MKKKSIVFVLCCAALLLGCSKKTVEPPKVIDKTANLLATGDSANDLLSNDKFTKLAIEIAYVSGFRPTAGAMDDFVAYIRKHTFKEEIELVYTELDSPEEETYKLEIIAQLEEDNRTVYNDGETLGVYIYFADFASDEDEDEEDLVTLGVVYRNTSMIIYEETVRRLAGSNAFIPVKDVESATINHEFGHLFGLVNLGTEQVNAHEDLDALNHCTVSGCLMQAELQFNASNPTAKLVGKREGSDGLKSACSLSGTSVLKMLELNAAKGQGIAPDLKAECTLDLLANGGR